MNQQLVIVRQFFDEARRAPSAQTPFVRMRRILDLDLCVELALGVVAGDHGTPDVKSKLARKDYQWPDLWDAADAATMAAVNKGLPSGKDLRTLHEQRNLAQHRGVIPSAENLSGWVEPVRELLAFICREFYQRDFERLEHWDVLECAPLRQMLTDCADAIQRGAHVPTMERLAGAYQSIANAVKMHVAGRTTVPTNWRHLDVETEAEARILNAVSAQLVEAQHIMIQGMIAIEAEVMAVGLGLSLADHVRFMRHTQGFAIDPAGDAEFMLHYLAKAAVTLESAVPGVLAGMDIGTSP